MTTALELITRSMQKIGALTKNESPSSDEASDALDSLNALISSWSNDSTKIYEKPVTNFTLVSGTAEYTIGPGATFSTSRPIKITAAYVRSNNLDYELDIISDENYAKIYDKSASGTPTFLNYTAGHPTGYVKFYPKPDQNYGFYFISEKEISSLSSLSTSVSFPPGWERALIYALAIELAPEYGQPVTEEIARMAMESKDLITKGVLKSKSIDVPQSLSTGNIYNGWQ